MFVHARNRDRPFHLGSFPLETLQRDDSVLAAEAARPKVAAPVAPAPGIDPLSQAADKYREIYGGFTEGEVAAQLAPLPGDPAAHAQAVKGFAYFLDAAQVGISRLTDNAWHKGATPRDHDFAVVILVEYGRIPETDNLAHAWVAPAARATADMRAAEIAQCVAGHIRIMGMPARAHVLGDSLVDVERLAVMAGLAVRRDDTLVNPYVERFALACVTTSFDMAADAPLDPSALDARGLAYWWGIDGAQSGRERRRRASRASHMSRYPMEQVKRVERPTTLILDDEVPRVPKRAAFFERALRGDLGPKAQRERTRFALKHPTAFSTGQLCRSLVPHQDGPVTQVDSGLYSDPAANARAVKSLSYFLGADLTGICEIPEYAWYSHDGEGKPIPPHHRYAIVMLIDQGFETMEGASGDDWISGEQSMRGYLRGAEIAGLMGEVLRGIGFPARSQTNLDSEVLQIPLILWAGLGELSRIGELVLNPFVGPRFKSVVLTTDMPLAVDKPIDFGLQTFCGHCLKCARECPCDAIPFGDKVMFNGYEMWKPDVERCTRYRVTNPKGAGCGRCMKTCPLNKVVDADGPWLTQAASWLGVNAMFLKPLMVPVATWLDDALGNGRINPVKRWWFDHEVVDGATVAPKGSNWREIDPTRKVDPGSIPMAYYPADVMPPPDCLEPVAVDRKAAIATGDSLETPAEARDRARLGGPAPTHYKATPPQGRT